MAIPPILAGGGLDTPAAHISEAEAREIALNRYGLAGEFKRFATEKDDTFRIKTQDGRAYVLKISNPAEPLEEIDFQIELLRYLEQQDPSLPVPRALSDQTGLWLTKINISDGTERFVRLLTYIDGAPLDSTTANSYERHQIGIILAKLRHGTASFKHTSQSRKLAWDVQHLPELAPLLEEVAHHEQRQLLTLGIERFISTTKTLQFLRRQVLHNDFSRSNIVVDHQSNSFVTGIIDFGDAVETAIVIDVSTALLNQLPRQKDPDPFAAGRDILSGYLSVADLTDEELQILPHLVMGRVITRALLTLWRARMFPQNAEYILRNTEQGWWQLQWFLSCSTDELVNNLLTSKPKEG